MSTVPAQIIGYRKDRLGARIVALGNLLSMEEKFGSTIRFLWAENSEEHNMDINDPLFPVFDEDFANKYLQQIGHMDRNQITGLVDLEEIRSKISDDLFRKRLSKGERFLLQMVFNLCFSQMRLVPTMLTRFAHHWQKSGGLQGLIKF